MRVSQIAVTGVGQSPSMLLDAYTCGFGDGLFLIPGAGATVSVEATPDDIMTPGVTPVWFPVAAALTGATANQAVALPFAARGLRLNQSIGASQSVLRVVTRGIIA